MQSDKSSIAICLQKYGSSSMRIYILLLKTSQITHKSKINCQFISASENIAWLLNIRGQDSEFTPMPNAYLTLDDFMRNSECGVLVSNILLL